MSINDDKGIAESLVRTKQRVADHGEVFTPEWLVKDMLNLVEDESRRIDSRFLEPACGSGNFLVQVLKRKLGAVEKKYGSSQFDREHFAMLALMSVYGIEILPDNISECRVNLLGILGEYLAITSESTTYRAGYFVLSQNLVHGDALRMRTLEDRAITFAEWGYLGKGMYQRRDFRLDTLTQSSTYSQEGTLFANLGMHELFTPIATYPPTTLSDLAAQSPEVLI